MQLHNIILKHDFDLFLSVFPVSSDDVVGILLGIVISLISICASLSQSLFQFLSLRIESNKYRWQIWRWLSYSMVHVNGAHLILNMVSLYFGARIAAHYRGVEFVLLIFALGTLVPAACVAFVRKLGHGAVNFVGASSGVFALFGALASVAPHTKLILGFCLPVPITGGMVGLFAVSLVLHATRWWPSVWHMGHALGIATGYGMAVVIG